MSSHRRGKRGRPSGAPAGAPVVGAAPRANSSARITWKFSAGFLLLVLLFSWLASSRPSAAVLHEPLTRLLASLAVPILALFGNAAAYGHDLVFNGFRATIEGACDGVQPTYIYIAAVLAFPSQWRAKAWGILLGIPAIFLINFVRIATMMLCGAYSPELFERVHLYGWQALVIALTLAVWLFWAELFVRQSDPTPA